MKSINKLFINGLLVLLPICLTVYLIVIISTTSETLFAAPIRHFMGDYYVPGIGIAVTFSFVFLTGFLASNFLTARIVRFFTLQFEKVPFIKTIYSPLKDLMSLFSGRKSKDMKKVVAVKLDGSKIETLGLVTREDFSDLNEESFTREKIAVYIPLSYMIGGITVIVGRESVRELNIPVDRAFRLAITGWIKNEEDND